MARLPWLLTAVPREHRAFRKHIHVSSTRRTKPTAAWQFRFEDREHLLAETGVGGDMVVQTLDWLARTENPRSVFLAGFAGGLATGLNVGDGILATGVVDPAGTYHAATLPLSLPYRTGTLLTSDRLISAPNDKRLLAEKHGALAVDMETSYVAAWCERRHVPWGCVRVVSDDVATPVSRDVLGLLEDGRVSIWRLTQALVRRPALIRELIHLNRATKIATQTIAAALVGAAPHIQND